MAQNHYLMSRRQIVLGAAASAALLPFAAPAAAQGLNLGNILGGASDSALDKLAKPGAYYNDKGVRIGLPLLGKSGGLFGSLLSGAEKLGILDNITRTVNDAAGVAAGEAKPIFRNAINNIEFSDVPGIVKQSDGGTQYLRRSANDDLHAKLTPLMEKALSDLGAFNQLDTLSKKHSFVRKVGLTREGMTKTVTDQGLDGIFAYMGTEEKAARRNPLGTAKSIIDIF